VASSIPAVPKDFFFQRGRGTGEASSSDQQIRVVLRLDGLFDLGRLERAVAAVVSEDPILRARFVEPRPFEARWELRDDAGAAPTCELAEVEATAAAAAIAAFLAELEVRADGPYFRLRVIRADGQDALCLRVDHRLCDGGGTKLLLYRLADRYRRLGAGEALPAPREDFQPRTVHGLTGRAPSAPPEKPEEPKGFSPLTYALPRLGAAKERPFHALQVIDAAATAAIRRAGKPLGATLTDALLTALTRALQPHALVPAGEPLTLMVSADCRTRLPPGTPEVLCNLSQGFFPALRCDPAQPFAAALAEVAQAMTRVRDTFTLDEALREEVGFAASFQKLAADPELLRARARRATTFVLLSNVGVLDEARLHLGAPALLDAQLLGTVALARELLVCASSFRGALTVSIGACASDVPPEVIAGIVERLAAELEGFARA